MKFVKFTENNDNEGESWNFWLPVTHNKKSLERLKKIVDLANSAGFDEAFELDMTEVAESEVDILVKHTDQGYMNYENKVTGVLILPDFDDALFDPQDEVDEAVFDWTNDYLYKGRIQELFQ